MGGGGLGDCKGLETWYLNQGVPKKVGQTEPVTYFNFKRSEEKLRFLIKSVVLFWCSYIEILAYRPDKAISGTPLRLSFELWL